MAWGRRKRWGRGGGGLAGQGGGIGGGGLSLDAVTSAVDLWRATAQLTQRSFVWDISVGGGQARCREVDASGKREKKVNEIAYYDDLRLVVLTNTFII